MSAGRVERPGRYAIRTGLLHEIPMQAIEPPYAEAMQLLEDVQTLWIEGLHVPGWDWAANGYPPGWGFDIASFLGHALALPSMWRVRRRRGKAGPPPRIVQ